MPEATAKVTLGGREVEMRKPTDGALVVLARTFRGLPKIENVEELTAEQRDRMVRNLGTIGRVVEQMIVKDDDKDWLDDAMIGGEVTAVEVFAALTEATKQFNDDQASPAKKAAPVRRRR